MAHFLKAFCRTVEGISERIGTGVSWLTSLLVVVVCYDVFTRYVLKSSSVAVQELEWHIFALLFLLGASFTLKHDRHVRVDVFYSRLSRRGKAWVDLAGSLLFLIPFCIVIIWSSQTFVANAFRISETSPDPGGLPGRFVLKAAIPAGFLLVLLQGISLAVRSALRLLEPGSSETANDEGGLA